MHIQGKPIGAGDVLKLKDSAVEYATFTVSDFSEGARRVYGRRAGVGVYEGFDAAKLRWPLPGEIVGTYLGLTLVVAPSGFIKVDGLLGTHYDIRQAEEWINRYVTTRGTEQ